MGHRAAADRRPSRALRRRRGARQDRGRGTPALPRRPSWRRPLTESDLRDGFLLVLIRFVLCVGGGFTLGLAYPAIDWAGTAWIALVPVFYVAVTAPPRTAFGWGWLAGFAFFLPLLRWLDFTFRTYSDIPWPLTWAPTLALSAYCGLYVGVFAAAVSWVARRSVARARCASPFLWVGGEWVRGHLFGGFPWGILGYAQYLRLPVIQIAELGGVYGVSLVIVAVNAALAGCLVLSWRSALGGVALAGVVLGGTMGFGIWRLGAPLSSDEAKVAIMQPTIEQPLKFEPNYAEKTVEIYLSLTQRAGAEHPDLIVWPETAVPTVLRRDE